MILFAVEQDTLRVATAAVVLRPVKHNKRHYADCQLFSGGFFASGALYAGGMHSTHRLEAYTKCVTKYCPSLLFQVTRAPLKPFSTTMVHRLLSTRSHTELVSCQAEIDKQARRNSLSTPHRLYPDCGCDILRWETLGKSVSNLCYVATSHQNGILVRRKPRASTVNLQGSSNPVRAILNFDWHVAFNTSEVNARRGSYLLTERANLHPNISLIMPRRYPRTFLISDSYDIVSQ